MKKAANQTSRVHWRMGQALLPEHFYTQERSLREEQNLRFQLLMTPSWGVGSLEWDKSQIQNGFVQLQQLSLVLPSGTLVDIPGNTAPASLALPPGGSNVSVFLHLQSAFDVRPAASGGESRDEGVECIVQKVELSTNPYSNTSLQLFKLAEFHSEPNGAWSLSPDYIPPLLLIGTSPFFEVFLRRMEGLVLDLREILLQEVRDNFLKAGSNAAGRLALRGLLNFEAMLIDLKSGLALHPLEVFRALRALYIDLCVHQDFLPGDIDKPYDHQKLAATFGRLLDRVTDQIKVRRSSVPYTEFSRKDGLVACELGKEAKRAKDVYLLVLKPQASAKVDLKGVKIASASRIQDVYQRSLTGISYRYVERPPFDHGLATAVDFYVFSPGEEWDHAVREGRVVFYDNDQLTSLRFFLYWRTE